MKKVQVKSNLTLNKTTVSRLSSGEMSAIQGGFTYALSTGEICQESNAKWDKVLEMGTTQAPVDVNTNSIHKPRNGYECSAL